LPLILLGRVDKEALPGVVRRVNERLQREVTPQEADMLWSAVLLLMGARYPAEFVQQLLQGVFKMKESSTYQAILAEGKAEEARRVLLLIGTNSFGAPDEATAIALEAMTSIEQLEQLIARSRAASNWQELLGLPRPRRRNGRRRKGP
jgi:hypothetical protein